MNHFKTAALMLFFFIYANSNGQDNLSKIEKLSAGLISTDFSVSGSSLGAETWGRYSNNKYYPWCSIFENPALISGERSPKIIFQFAPEVSYGFTRLTGISPTINDELDNNIETYGTQDLHINYPSVNLKLSRKINLPEGMLLFPIKKYTIGLSYHRSIVVSMLLDWVGSEITISTDLNSGGSTNKVILNNYLDTTNQFDYYVTSTSVIISRLLNNKTILAIQAERLYYDWNLSGNWNIQGSMLYNGKEYLFNDPETLWPTAICQNIRAKYNGVGWRVNLGGIYIINSKWIVDGSLSFISNTFLDGKLTGNRNKIPALNINALKSNEGADEILEPSKLNPSQLTFTENIPWEEHSKLKQTLPGQFKIGLLFTTGKWGFYFSDRFYFGNFRWQYGDNFLNISPKQQIKFYINRGGIFTKFGIYLLKMYSPETQDLSVQSGLLALPQFSFGYSTKITKQMLLIGSLGILPIPGVNFSVQYKL